MSEVTAVIKEVHSDYLKELQEYFEEHGFDCELCLEDIESLKMISESD